MADLGEFLTGDASLIWNTDPDPEKCPKLAHCKLVDVIYTVPARILESPRETNLVVDARW